MVITVITKCFRREFMRHGRSLWTFSKSSSVQTALLMMPYPVSTLTPWSSCQNVLHRLVQCNHLSVAHSTSAAPSQSKFFFDSKVTLSPASCYLKNLKQTNTSSYHFRHVLSTMCEQRFQPSLHGHRAIIHTFSSKFKLHAELSSHFAAEMTVNLSIRMLFSFFATRCPIWTIFELHWAVSCLYYCTNAANHNHMVALFLSVHQSILYLAMGIRQITYTSQCLSFLHNSSGVNAEVTVS